MTQDRTRIIELDPFFDRADGSPSPTLQAMQHQPIVNGFGQQPEYGGYAPADPHTMQNMRPSAAGLRGTIIPRATIGGIPVGTRPHATQDVVVNIDPHIVGQSSAVRLGDINAHSVNQAAQRAAQITPEPTDIATVRLRGAAMMHSLAHNSRDQGFAAREAAPIVPRQQVPPFQPQQAQVVQPQQVQQPQFPQQQQRPQAQVSRRAVSPLAAFNQPRQPEGTREFREIDIPYSQPPAEQVGPPQVQVIFEMEHFGTLPVNYHDVIVQEGFMVLVFDTRHTGSTKYFPPTQKGDVTPRMAVSVVGTNEVFLVQTTGVQFEHDYREFCILMIEQTGALE